MASPAPALLISSTGGSWRKSVSWSGPRTAPLPVYRLRLTVADMNYATRRIAELQAPWISDDHRSHQRGDGHKRGELMPARMSAATGSAALPGKLP